MLHARKSSQFQSNRRPDNAIFSFWVPLIFLGVFALLLLMVNNIDVYRQKAGDIDAAQNFVEHNKCAWVEELRDMHQHGTDLEPDNKERVDKLSSHVSKLGLNDLIRPCAQQMIKANENPFVNTAVHILQSAATLPSMVWMCMVLILFALTLRLTRLVSLIRLCSCCRASSSSKSDAEASASSSPEYRVFSGVAEKAVSALETQYLSSSGSSRFDKAKKDD